MPVRWLAETLDDRGAAARIGRDGDDLIAEWLGIARLTASRDGKRVTVTPERGAEPRGVEKIRRGVVALLLRQLEGKLGLHGAAIAVDGRAVVFVGASGHGKSTLAAHCCRSLGAPLFADDSAAIDRTDAGWIAVPLEQDHWLDEGAENALGVEPPGDRSTAKRPRRAERVATDPAPLAMIALLAYADVDAPRLVPLRGVEAIAALVTLLVRFVIDEPELQRRELDALSDLAASVPIVRLERPRGLDHLASTARAVVDALSEGRSAR